MTAQIPGELICGPYLFLNCSHTDCWYHSRVDFENATEKELSDLMSACQPATFGRDQLDVLDEDYRKAGKLDLTHFASKFDLGGTGIMKTVKYQLIDASDGGKVRLRPELYKLNVYSKSPIY